MLAQEIGPRHAWRPEALERAATFLEHELAAAGFTVGRQAFRVRAQEFRNLEVELAGGPQIVVVGAHYDTVAGGNCPGANDNGSGVAAVLALARRCARLRPERTLRFVLFVNATALARVPAVLRRLHDAPARRRPELAPGREVPVRPPTLDLGRPLRSAARPAARS